MSVADAIETVEAGGLYVVNDDGERKATGAYYTPDYVVSYIVEETIDPLIDEIKADLSREGLLPGDMGYFGGFYSRVLQLRVLDPAMGSAHFLTSATAYLTEQVMEVSREQEQGHDERQIRRTIAKECIYGVDINGMAVELGKLSMWLETLAADKPLAFLDHHLKAGNSLVGSDITEVLSDDSENGGGQLTLSQSFARARQQTLGHVMDLMADLLAIENEGLADIKSMEQLYDEIRDDPLYGRLFEIANVHTAEQFGVDVPEGAYEDLAMAIDDVDAWAEIEQKDWFTAAQTLAGEQDFFHWELEYPEVFFSGDGQKLDEAGFDAVIGNPPYIKTQNLRGNLENVADYLIAEPRYKTAEGRFDIYSLFIEQGVHLAAYDRVTYILSNKFYTRKHGKPLRRYVTSNKILKEILDFGQMQVFDGATTYTCILSLEQMSESFDYMRTSENLKTTEELRNLKRVTLKLEEFGDDPWVLTGPKQMRVLKRMENLGSTVGDISKEIAEGITSGDNDVLFVEIVNQNEDLTTIISPADNSQYTVESDLVRPLTNGDDINRFEPPYTDFGVIYPYRVSGDQTVIIPENELKNEYSKTYDYLSQFRERLANRGTKRTNSEYKTWYAHYRARDMNVFENPKLLTPDICGKSEFTIDNSGGLYFRNSAFGFVPEKNTEYAREFYISVLNSTLTWFYMYLTSTVLENDFRRFTKSYLSPLPIPKVEPKDNPNQRAESFENQLNQFFETDVAPNVEEPTTFLAYLGREQLNLNGRISTSQDLLS